MTHGVASTIAEGGLRRRSLSVNGSGRYLRIRPSGGDGYYSVSELQVFSGENDRLPTTVPILYGKKVPERARLVEKSATEKTSVIEEGTPLPDHPVLPDDVSALIRKYDPDFRMWTTEDFLSDVIEHYNYSKHQRPERVVADITGDGKTDYVVWGRTGNIGRVLAVVSENGSYLVIPVRERRPVDGQLLPLSEFLSYSEPGNVWGIGHDAPVHIDNGGFEFVGFEAYSVLYYYENGKFNSITTGD